MIESIVRDFLESKVDVPVLMEIPKSPSSNLIIIEKIGGGDSDHIPSSILAIQSYGSTLLEAAKRNDEVKHWMLDGLDGIITLDEISSVSLNSDYNYTDTSEKRYRYQAVYDITHY